MATDKPETKKAFIIRAFTDAGTGESFAASKDEKDTDDIEVGAFANYAAAGLVREPGAKNAAEDAPAA